MISPDVATCDACLADTMDPANRRFGYAFTNCTNCGPRYTIIRGHSVRPSEDDDGGLPDVRGLRAGISRPGRPAVSRAAECLPGVRPVALGRLPEARGRLAAGEILAIKGLGGFHLACDARNDAAVRRLRERKRRSDKPFALMVPRSRRGGSHLRGVGGGPAVAEQSAAADRPDAGAIEWPACAPGNRTLGIMLPYKPLHHLLFVDAAYDALVMTSGNLSEEPIVVSNEEALARLAGVADWFLLHNRDIYMRTDDSVVRTFEGRERLMRRSRGYAPEVMDLGRSVPEVLACGGELKNVFCLTKGRHAILSQHIGDLENYETLVFFEETLANLKKLFRVEPRAVAHDLHPMYLSTKYALRLGLPAIGVQHHHAHLASCMLENGLDGEAIGVCLDGPAMGRTERSGAANSWWADTAGSNGGRTCATSRWRAAMRRCGSRGVRRWRT